MSYLVNAMGHVQLNVVDVDALVRESRDILGLRVTREDAGCVWLSSNGRMAELVLHEAGENAIRSLGFEAVSEARWPKRRPAWPMLAAISCRPSQASIAA